MKVYQIYFILIGVFLGGAAAYSETGEVSFSANAVSLDKPLVPFSEILANLNVHKHLTLENYRRIRELMEDRRYLDDCGLEGRDCRLSETEESCLLEKVNELDYAEQGVWAMFPNNLALILYFSTIRSILHPVWLELRGLGSYLIDYRGELDMLSSNLALISVFYFIFGDSVLGDSIKGHHDCFSPSRKKIYNELILQNEKDQWWNFVTHLAINVGLLTFMHQYERFCVNRGAEAGIREMIRGLRHN